ncbi:MAG TPA: DNA polymerase I [Thermoleophilaceae bacterium]|nr:DNA polymerase I [Thermoleophilaceae bacterium]
MAPQLFLIDGNSLVYRAFFALPDTIATSKGEPTNAIFGFASMLVKLLTEYGSVPTLVVWDAGWSGREEVYTEYKAERKSRPDLLRDQWPALEPLVDAFGYRNVRSAGYEADDVIATLATQAKEKGIDVMIVTGDRDTFQLVEPGIGVMATGRGITDTKIYDREAVLERYGIPPELIPDFYGLKGDTSDNIPGVPGIGDKTAATLLQEYGDLEGVLSSIDKISGAKRKENLTNHADDARVSKELATSIRDVPVEVDLEECAAQPPDRSELREVFRRWELRDPLRRLEEFMGAEEAGAARKTETLLEAKAIEVPLGELASLSGEMPALATAWTTDDAGASSGPLRFAAFAGGDVLVGETESPEALSLAWAERPATAHDWKSMGLHAPLAHDTMVAGYLIDPSRRNYDLQELAEDAGFSAQVEGADGLASAAVVTRALAQYQREVMEEEGLTSLFHDIELPLVDVLVEMEHAGIKLDIHGIDRIAGKVEQDAGMLEREIHELADEEFTIGSPQQLSTILFDKLALSKKRRGKTGFSTDARVLAAIRDEHEIIPKIERWRELTKLKSTYLDALPQLVDENHRLHTTFNQTATTTGRLSSTDPNLQNIPIRTELGREIRACFIADDGTRLVSADYSQVELRILSHISGEQALRDIFAAGGDVHTETAATIFRVAPGEIDPGMRSKAKMVNFGIVYGLSAFGMADRLNIPQEEAAEFIERYLGRFPQVKEFIDKTIGQATADGYVRTLLGRIRRIPELRSSNWQTRQLGERLAVNTVIQGTAADIIKIAMVRCHEALRESRTKLVLQIHDELLFEAPEDEAGEVAELVQREMATAFALDPPLAVDVGVGVNWLEAK